MLDWYTPISVQLISHSRSWVVFGMDEKVFIAPLKLQHDCTRYRGTVLMEKCLRPGSKLHPRFRYNLFK